MGRETKNGARKYKRGVLMLIKRLKVRQNAVFENIDIEFDTGLNAISGASGAGKSVLIASLLGAFGLKESNALNIEVEFLAPFLDTEKYGIFREDNDEPLVISVIKREKTRYFLNQTSLSKNTLKELLKGLIKRLSNDRFSQNELDNDLMLALLDGYIISLDKQFMPLLDNFKENFENLELLEKEIRLLEDKKRFVKDLEERLNFEKMKLERLNLEEDEYERLLEQKKLLSHKEKLSDKIIQALKALETSHKITHALESMGENAQFLESALMEASALLEKEQTKLEECEHLDAGAILERLSELSSVIKDYGSILNAKERLIYVKNELSHLSQIDENCESLHSQRENLKKECIDLCAQLSALRIKYLQGFNTKLQAKAKELLLKNPSLILEEVSMDKKGSQKLVLNLENSVLETLSSGEYSRLRLAFMLLEMEFLKDFKGVLVLDEMDSNLSGEESLAVSKALEVLSECVQIFAISHQVHIPAIAKCHILVYKDKQKSMLKILENKERVLEIARMVGGSENVESAINFAKEKLKVSE
ncbi:DNA repair protein [Helicobacter cetorum MIT 00-7128]|uniref:DNA repair protein RecN n=2 Tax=Helicobacter cetorum TaxID=138563 RepID=I0EKN5_HELC0|nr:DNA repair protein [Helicobacter cetorum MIT 00-7128]